MTMAQINSRPRRNGRFAKLYAGTWTVLALLALAYMITLATNPSVLGNWTPERSTPETNEGQRSVARFATDLTGLRQSVGEIQRDMTALRTAVQIGTSRDKEMVERIAVLEERTKPQIPVVAEAAAPAAPKTAAQRQTEARALKAAEKVATASASAVAADALPASEASTSRFVVLNAPVLPANPIATGSIPANNPAPPAQGVPAPPVAAQASASFGPGAIRASAPPAPAGLEIASGPSLEALRLNWSLLADRHASQLKNLEARYTSAGEGQPYQLLAGPISSADEAKRVCAQLQAKRVTCRVTGFGGNAL